MSVPALTVAFDMEGQSLPVGRIVLHEHRALFEYDRAFLQKALEPSPARLKALPGVHAADRHPFGGLHGLFADSLPDSYGRMLLERRLQQLGRDPNALTVIDRLALVGRRGLGALTYAPAEEIEVGDVAPALDLDRIQREALGAIAGEPSAILPLLHRLGGSAGGARPKALIWLSPDRKLIHPAADAPGGQSFEPWIIKFRAPADPADLGPVEFAYNSMAEACGLEVSDRHLFPSADGPGYFATRRFDIGESGRLHSHSLAGLLQTEPFGGALSYTELMRATSFLTRDVRAVAAAFRRMAFNVLAHNRDDHGKNHGFLMNARGEWRLAPAFDLSFSHGPGGEHYLSVSGDGRHPTRAAMLALGLNEGLKRQACLDIIEEVRAGVARWPGLADDAGLTRERATEIGATIASADRA